MGHVCRSSPRHNTQESLCLEVLRDMIGINDKVGCMQRTEIAWIDDL